MDILIRCLDVPLYEYMDTWIYGYMNIYIIPVCPVYQGESSISAVLSILWVSHIWIFEYIDVWMYGYADI